MAFMMLITVSEIALLNVNIFNRLHLVLLVELRALCPCYKSALTIQIKSRHHYIALQYHQVLKNTKTLIGSFSIPYCLARTNINMFLDRTSRPIQNPSVLFLHVSLATSYGFLNFKPKTKSARTAPQN